MLEGTCLTLRARGEALQAAGAASDRLSVTLLLLQLPASQVSHVSSRITAPRQASLGPCVDEVLGMCLTLCARDKAPQAAGAALGRLPVTLLLL